MPGLRVAIDIGGTFTDFVIAGPPGFRTYSGKTLTTPQNLADGVIAGLNELIDNQREIDYLVHGTTVGLNAVLERRGSRVLLVSTAGVRDFYSIARGDRRELYALQYRKPERLVPRRDVMEVRERLQWDGSVLAALREDDFGPIIERIRTENIGAVAVCFLHSYVNPVHELKARAILHASLPGVSITLSHEVAREWREYERASTAVMNAYIAPVVEGYLTRLESELVAQGIGTRLHVMQSNGGVMTAAAARELPINTLLSGPVGGAIGGVGLAEATGRSNLLCIDMGGTSFDMSLVVGGKPRLSSEAELEGLPILMPLVDIHTIGAGGGSIAWLEGGALRVGPQSAGADPGPACYGRGGTKPTVTDANLVLGRLSATQFLGGRMRLDIEAASAAIKGLAASLALTEVTLAKGILAIVNARMADAMRTITVRHGIDPRDFCLVAFGGAGAMHAVWLAEELNMPEVVVPWSPGTFSAWGMLTTDIRRDLTMPFFRRIATVTVSDVGSAYESLAATGRRLLKDENVAEADTYFIQTADMRYVGQEYSVSVPIPDQITLTAVASAFHDSHLMLYGHATPDAPVEFVNLRLAVLGRMPHASTVRHEPGEEHSVLPTTRTVVFDDGPMETRIFLRQSLKSGEVHTGPLVVEDDTATAIVPPGWSMAIDELSNLVIARARAE
jgi:N-methylhydantoinase A